MATSLAVITAIVAAAIQVAAARLPIGVASTMPDGRICVALPEPRLAAGAAVTLVLIQPDSQQSALLTTIDRPIASCDALQYSTVHGPYHLYLLRRPKTMGAKDRTGLWVAFAGRVRSRPIDDGRIALQLSASEPNAQVRSCTTQEGVILEVWAGTPRKSSPLWSEYYYLGYDVEPSCTEDDKLHDEHDQRDK